MEQRIIMAILFGIFMVAAIVPMNIPKRKKSRQ
jgi:hypothetical protein